MPYQATVWAGPVPAVTAFLASLGHPDFVPAPVARDARIASFGAVSVQPVAGRATMFALASLIEGATVELPADVFPQTGVIAVAAVGRFLAVPKPVTYKTDVWDRASEDEAAFLDAALSQASPRQKRMWADCTRIEHDSPMFGLLMSQMGSVFGEARALQLLAPSQID